MGRKMQFSLSLDETILGQLMKIAEQQESSIAFIIRRYIKKGMAAEGVIMTEEPDDPAPKFVTQPITGTISNDEYERQRQEYFSKTKK